MQADLRELILTRLLEIGTSLPGIVTAARNRALLETENRPAFLVLDGDERIRLSGDRRGRMVMSPSLVTMNPQCWIWLESRQTNEAIGPDINDFRLALIGLIANDSALAQLVGSNGNISYEGCETDLKSGLPGQGSMRLDFAITYLVDPYQP